MTTRRPARQHRGRTYCANCDAVTRYRLDAAGLWECTACGFGIECVECGHTLHKNHDCNTDTEALQ